MSRRPLVLISGREPAGAGGHESYVRAHARAAMELGYEPRIFSVTTGLRSRVERTGFGVVHSMAAPGRRRPVVLQVLPLADAVVRFLAPRPGPHLIHGFGIRAFAAVDAARRLSDRGVPAVAVASSYARRAYEVGARHQGLRRHHGLAQRLGHAIWLRWVLTVEDRVECRGYKGASAVLVNYESVQRMLEDAFGGGMDIRRVPYAAERSFFEASQPPAPPSAAKRPVILAVSRQDSRKGVDVLLFALAELARDGIAFCANLVGPGTLLEAHRRLASNLGLADRVSLPGRVEDVAPYYAEARVFVLPSLAEGSGSMSVLEALHAGVPVIASASDGIPEDLTDGVDAVLVPPGDPAALAAALRTVLTDPERRAELASNARRAHGERFSAGRFVEALGEVYAELGVLPAAAPRLDRTASAT
jgi:glycosyltransferase involved in cell wall biosynthesis